jgi:hypothetical protein
MAGKPAVLVATETFSADLGGETVVVHKGETRVRANHPLVKASPHLFEPAEPQPDIEAPKRRSRKR